MRPKTTVIAHGEPVVVSDEPITVVRAYVAARRHTLGHFALKAEISQPTVGKLTKGERVSDFIYRKVEAATGLPVELLKQRGRRKVWGFVIDEGGKAQLLSDTQAERVCREVRRLRGRPVRRGSGRG